jgi:CubicO group peptidase (beta-lactamase class C family)
MDSRNALPLPASADTAFRLASVSKPFTAIAILQLVERGLIDLDQPAQHYVPEIPWPQVTVRQLLNHTGGVPDYLRETFVKSRPDNRDVFRAMRNRKLEFIPGTDVHYSNTGYAALGLVLETVAGEDYAACLRQQVFAPCGMERAAVPRWDWTSLPDRATGYERHLRLYLSSDTDCFNGMIGDGGVFASAAELDRWLDALHGGKLLKEATLKQAFQAPLPHPGALPYGFGWVITRFGKDTLIWHNGSWLGFDTFVGRLIGQRANIVLLSNAGLQGRGLDLADDLAFPLAERLVAAK